MNNAALKTGGPAKGVAVGRLPHLPMDPLYCVELVFSINPFGYKTIITDLFT